MQSLYKAALLFWLLAVTAAGAWAGDGRIIDIVGDVRVNGQPATADTELNRNDTIVTGDSASVRIVLSDNSVLDIDSGSEIKLSDYSYEPSEPEENTSEVSLVEGSLRYVSGLIAREKPENVSFKAGNATIGVRGSFTAIALAGNVANVEAMIGEATLSKEGDDEIIVPTGKTTQIDPATGKVLVVPSTATDPVNEVVRALAAIAPDAGDPEDEGCSRGRNPLRATADPDTDSEKLKEIERMLSELSEGELMMVIAVLSNNARHLCIDSRTIADAITIIARVNPEATDSVQDVADALEPQDNEDRDPATQTSPQGDTPADDDIPPGGNPPSPE